MYVRERTQACQPIDGHYRSNGQQLLLWLGLPPVPDYTGRPGFKTLCPASRMNPIRDANVPDFPQDIVHIVKLP